LPRQENYAINVLQILRTLNTIDLVQFLQSSSMPRGTCENCGQHDAFVYSVPLALGRNLFVCARCLNLLRAREEDEDEDECIDDAAQKRNPDLVSRGGKFSAGAGG
jgi:hypothetical protein